MEVIRRYIHDNRMLGLLSYVFILRFLVAPGYAPDVSDDWTFGLNLVSCINFDSADTHAIEPHEYTHSVQTYHEHTHDGASKHILDNCGIWCAGTVCLQAITFDFTPLLQYRSIQPQTDYFPADVREAHQVRYYSRAPPASSIIA